MNYFLCRNAQRPGVVTGMTIAEYRDASGGPEDTLIILVHAHKGARPARVVAHTRMATELEAWVTSLRPLFVQEESPLLFCSRSGAPLVQISRKVTELAKSFGASVPPATASRKAIATSGGCLDSEGKAALAHSMSHTQATADIYYRAYGEAKSVQGFEAVGSILNIPEEGKKKRQKFTEEQTEAIGTHFATYLKEKVQHSGKEIDSFLNLNAAQFKGRVRGDIYSKIRNMIGRERK